MNLSEHDVTFLPVEGRECGYLIAEPAGAEAAPQ